MSHMSGTYYTTKKDGTPSYRSSITYNRKHISLGSYPSMEEAGKAYYDAQLILKDDSITLESCTMSGTLSFEKQITLINLRDNHIYIPTPVYLRRQYFEYYINPDLCLKFDTDDLFYYSSHKIMMRGHHLCVADYGSQVSLNSRYGIKPYSIPNRDFVFCNGDCYDYRRHNIEIINRYQGVQRIKKGNYFAYKAVIHVRSNYVIGTYDTEDKAAIAYNKAIDLLHKKGVRKNFTPNFLEGISPIVYASIYTDLKISNRIINFCVKK